MPARKSNSSRKPSARRTLANQLARLRDESGKSLADLADETTYDRTYLHKLETGHRTGSPEVMASLDAVYGTDGLLEELWELAREDQFPDRYKRFDRVGGSVLPALPRHHRTCGPASGGSLS
jgi:transcriptional regulator with XRE-family HTH domain